MRTRSSYYTTGWSILAPRTRNPKVRLFTARDEALPTRRRSGPASALSKMMRTWPFPSCRALDPGTAAPRAKHSHQEPTLTTPEHKETERGQYVHANGTDIYYE